MFRWICMGAILVLTTSVASAVEPVSNSLADSAFQWPTWQQWRRVLLLQDYNTRVVVFGVAVLGGAAGLIGSFTLLRKRALMGDALSHAALPGLTIAFVIATVLGADGKSLGILLLGATISGMLGVGAILWIRNQTRLKEDAALGIVLSVFFGLGVSVLSVIQQMQTGHAAGLEGFIYGKTASMSSADARLIMIASLIVLIGCSVLFKELKLLCFDEGFAGSRGFPTVALDICLMAMVVLITIVGLQAVGMILMIALMVIPAAAARFWTDEMTKMAIYSAILGTVGSIVGATLSAVFPRLPSGAMIVLVCSFFFFLSMMFGPSRGVVFRFLRRWRLNRRIDRQHLMRAMYELAEPESDKGSVTFERLLAERSWSKSRLRRAIRDAEDDTMVRLRGDRVRLTSKGTTEAARLTRQHRMWEMYLIAYAEIAPARVDRDADDIEHVLEPEVIDQLEELLEQEKPKMPVPRSPHELPSSSGVFEAPGRHRMMPSLLAWSSYDNWIVVVGALSAVAAALLGNFLVLRKMSMLGDAVTHAVLPGIAIAFLVTHSRHSLPMFIGAVIVGVLTALFTEWIRGIGRVDEGASMGVVFTSLFAFGLVLLVQAANHVDLDPNCVLHGLIEMVTLDTLAIGDYDVPRSAVVLSVVTLINALFVTLFFKELKISSFDPSLATTMGFSATLMHYALMVLVSVTAVASFESVGSILVVAMFVVPPAAAYMLTDRLSVMIGLSVLIAIASAALGHVSAIVVPTWFGYKSMTTAGMMAVVAGLLFSLAACFGPRHGVIIKAIRRQRLSLRILCDDVVSFLYRREERDEGAADTGLLADELFSAKLPLNVALRRLISLGESPGERGRFCAFGPRARPRTSVGSFPPFMGTVLGIRNGCRDGSHPRQSARVRTLHRTRFARPTGRGDRHPNNRSARESDSKGRTGSNESTGIAASKFELFTFFEIERREKKCSFPLAQSPTTNSSPDSVQSVAGRSPA